MGDKSSIEWTDATWNPIVGCSILSPGRKPGYINHYDGTTEQSKAGPVWTGKVALAPDKILLAPLGWKKPRRIFVNSMGDLFHESVPDEWIVRVLDIIRRTSVDGGSNCGKISGAGQHIYQVLTKRAARMAAFMPRLRFDSRDDRGLYLSDDDGPAIVMKNLWLGVSAERQQEANYRIPLLLVTPAVARFVSLEPLLGPIYLTEINYAGYRLDALAGFCEPHTINFEGLDQVIVGGESGRSARPMHPQWARSLRDQCAAADVPFFFKQWGEWLPGEANYGQFDPRPMNAYRRCDNHSYDWPNCSTVQNFGTHADVWSGDLTTRRVGKRAAGRLLDGVEYNGFPEVAK